MSNRLTDKNYAACPGYDIRTQEAINLKLGEIEDLLEGHDVSTITGILSLMSKYNIWNLNELEQLLISCQRIYKVGNHEF